MNDLIVAYTWHGLLRGRIDAERVTAGDLAVLNPSDGPIPDDASELANVKKAITQIRAAKGIVFGYVHVSISWQNATGGWEANPGARPNGDVLADIALWRDVYGVKNIMFDETPNTWTVGQLNALAGAALQSAPPTTSTPQVIFNMGTRPLQPMKGLDSRALIVVHEGTMPPVGVVPGKQEAVIVHSYAGDPAALRALLKLRGWRYSYVTADGPDGNPFDEAS